MPNGESTIQLSEREMQVLEMVVTGASNQEIARKLVISINTVKVHMRNIFEKMGVQSRTEASLRAIQEGLVSVPENEAAFAKESETLTPKTFLLEATAPIIIPQWQQGYLLFAALVAVIVATFPLLFPLSPAPSGKPTHLELPTPELIYNAPTPTPPVQPGRDKSRWVSYAPMPTNRAGLALVAFEERIFAIGGVRVNNKETRSVEIYDSVTDNWTEGASKLSATTDVAGVILGDKIYVPGGCTNDGQAIESVEIYDPTADAWTNGAPLPEARCGYGLAAFQDKLYLFGGWNGKEFKDTIYVFSPQEDSWEVLKNTMPYPVGYVGAAVLNDAIYIVGGYDGQDEFDQTYSFNPETGKWRKMASLQEKRGGLGLVSSSDNIYAIGGGWDNPVDISEKYDPEADSWTSFEAPFTNQGRNLGVTIIGTKIYAVGGWDGDEETFMNSVTSYQFLYQFFVPISGF